MLTLYLFTKSGPTGQHRLVAQDLHSIDDAAFPSAKNRAFTCRGEALVEREVGELGVNVHGGWDKA